METESGVKKMKLAPNYANVVPYVIPEGGIVAIICNLDGTLAHNESRTSGIKRHIYDYTKVREDTVDSKVLRALLHMTRGSEHVIFMTGRPDSCRENTELWLNQYLKGYSLFMRKDGDHRPDYEVKYELFNRYVRQYFDIICALDDRNQVVGLWRALDLLCLQVAPGDF